MERKGAAGVNAYEGRTIDGKGTYWEVTKNKVGCAPGVCLVLAAEGLQMLKFKCNCMQKHVSGTKCRPVEQNTRPRHESTQLRPPDF
jgi:hypothetical protein